MTGDSKQHARAIRRARIALLTSALAACGGKSENEPHDATGGVSPEAGGAAAAGSTTGGRGGTGGNSTSTTGGGGAAGNSTSTTGGSGGVAGAATGGTEGCIDACGLYGSVCCIPSLDCVRSGATCVFDVLAEAVDTTYDYATLEKRVAALSRDVLVSFTDSDIAWAAAESAPAARIEMHLTPQLSARSGDILEGVYNHPFHLSCNGQRLFVGVVYDRGGAAALHTPVLHVDRDADNSLIVRLGAWQGAWAGLDFFDEPGARERIDQAEFRAALCQRGALGELDP